MAANDREPGRWHRHIIRVRYQETDQMGIVYHANYIIWFEIGRTELIRQRGLSYRAIEERGLYLPVVELESKFRLPAKYDDTIGLYTRIAACTAMTVHFESRVCRLPDAGGSGRLAAEKTAKPTGTSGAAGLAGTSGAAELAGAPCADELAGKPGAAGLAGTPGGEAAAGAFEGADAAGAPKSVEPEGELLVTGVTRHMWLNRDWKPARIDREAPELYRLLGEQR